MVADVGHLLAVLFEQVLRTGTFAGVEVADLLVPQELQLGMFEAELVHDGQGVFEIATDPVGDDTQFHSMAS